MAGSAPTPDDGIVRVTLNTVYQKQLEASIDTAEIKGTLLLVSQNMSQVIETGKDHEARLRELEKDAVREADAKRLTDQFEALQGQVLTKSGMYAAVGAMCAVAIVISSVIGLALK